MSKTKKETPALRVKTVSREAEELVQTLRFLDYVAQKQIATQGNADYVRNVLQQFEAEVGNYLRPIRERLNAARNHEATTPS